MLKEARQRLLESPEYKKNLEYLFPYLEKMHQNAQDKYGSTLQVCVTGASGAYGTELVDAMMYFNQKMSEAHKSERFQVVGQTSNIDSRNNELFDNPIYKRYYKPLAKDIRDGIAAADTLSYAYVINLASNAEPQKYIDDPQGTYDIIQKGTSNIIKYAEKHPSSRVIQISSVEACGKVSGEEGLRINEDTYASIDESNTYGIAKRESEMAVRNTQGTSAHVLVARFPRSFSLCDNEDRKIFGPAMITDALKGNQLIQKSNGQIRDTSDSTTVLAQMITIAASGNCGEVYNMSNPHLVAQMSDFTRTCAKIAGVDCQIGAGGDLGRNTATETGCVLTPDKFFKQFPDFKCRYDNLEDAIRDTMIVKSQAYDIQNYALQMENTAESTIKLAFGEGVGQSEKDAGVFVIEFDNGQIGDILRKNTDDIIDYTEALIGSAEEKSGQKLFISQNFYDEETDRTQIAILFKGLSSENEGEVEAALKRACRDYIEDNSSLRENVDFTFGYIRPVLSSQVQNAITQYSVDEKTKPFASLTQTTVNDNQKLNENLLSGKDIPNNDIQMQ